MTFLLEVENKWTGPFTFIQAADSQFGLIDRYIMKKTTDISWDKEIKYLRLTINSINALSPKPKFIVICGDLVDAYPEACPQYPNPDVVNIRAAQIKDLKSVLTELDPCIKLVCICGNHDVGDTPTIQSIDAYKKEFGEDYYSFWVNGCKFICLNSQIYFDSSKIPELKLSQDKWLNDELAKDNNDYKHLTVFQHIPLFLETADEPPDVYFNLPLDERKSLIRRFKAAGVKKVFCGHYHRNAGGFDGDLECIVTSAIGLQIGSDGHGYRIVNVNEKDITHQYITISDEIN